MGTERSSKGRARRLLTLMPLLGGGGSIPLTELAAATGTEKGDQLRLDDLAVSAG